MGKVTGHILKNKDIKLEGQFHLDLGQTASTPARKSNVAFVTPQVHIVENHPEFAVIEIICSCGTKTHIRCEYTNVQSTNQESEQTK